MNTLYLSGPMRGYAKFNFPLFNRVAAELRAHGLTIKNPAEHDCEVYPDIESWEGFESGDTATCPKFILPDSLMWDFHTILNADGIALLPGWEKSSGARAERFVAECVGKRVYLVSHTEGGEVRLTPDDDTHRMHYPEVKS